jgi:putative hydrolase
MKKTKDWVVIYMDSNGGDRQYTVITSQHHPFLGKRIVRGREDECAEYYRVPETAAQRSGKKIDLRIRLASGAN